MFLMTDKTISNIQVVHDFIVKLRAACGGKLGPEVRLEPRDEVTQGIADIGITKAQARAEVSGLQIRNYCNGPEDDKDVKNGAGEVVWVFTKRIMNKNAYIKIKIVNKNCSFVKCLSFHPADFPICPAFSNEEISKYKAKIQSENGNGKK